MYTVAAKENVILGKYFETFETGANGYVVTFQESSEIIAEFPKIEPFNRKLRKFQDENEMERKLMVTIFVFGKFG